jgi:polyferredoxin
MGRTSAIVVALLLVLSVLVKNVWCRYLCPYGALMGLAGLFSPARISRDPGRCIDCARCARACPAGLPVDRRLTVKSAECTACLSCVSVCPAEGALALALPGPGRVPGRMRFALVEWTLAVPPWALCAGVLGVFFAVVAFAHLTGHWFTELPDALYFDLIPRAREFGHP